MIHGISSGKQRRRLSLGSFQPQHDSTQRSPDALVVDASDAERLYKRKTRHGSLLCSALNFSRSKHPKQHAFSQHQSRFLSRLPAEVRLMIYHYVNDCKRVHIVPTHGKLVSVPCNLPDSDGQCAVHNGFDAHGFVQYMRIGRGCCRQSHPAGPVYLDPDMVKGIKGAVNLLSICRRVCIYVSVVAYHAPSLSRSPPPAMGDS